MLTPVQKELRKGHLGASDSAALFGLDPFKTATDVWLTKCFGIVEPEKQSDNIELGNTFEAPLLAWGAKELGVEISTKPDDLFAVSETNPIFSATLDARIKPFDIKEALEAKVTSRADEYGEPFSDQIPDRTNIQVQHQMFVHQLQHVHIVVLMGKMGLKRELYYVDRNEQIIQAIIQKGEYFWRDFILTKQSPPEGEFGLGSIDIIKRVIRQPETWAEIPDALILDWDAKRVARLDAEKAEKEALSRVLTPLGDAEGVRMADGRILSYFPTTKTILDQAKLKAEHPSIYQACLKESVSRTPRIKGGVQ